MTIDLPWYYQHIVIDTIARALMSEIRGQRLAGIGSLPPSSRIELREIQAMVRSVPRGIERDLFIDRLRHRFHNLRQEQGMHPRSTAFYAAVEEFNRTRP